MSGRVIDRTFGIFKCDQDPALEVGVWIDGSCVVARDGLLRIVEIAANTVPLTYGRMGLVADAVFAEYGVEQ